MYETGPRYHRWPKRLLWEQIGRAGELRQAAHHLDLGLVFAGGMNDHRRDQFVQRARDLFIALNQSARERGGKIVNRG
jgi:hypothetical protein